MNGSPAWRTDPPVLPDGADVDDLDLCRALDVRWTRLGYSLDDIAAALGRSVRTVERWRSKWPGHGAAIDEARANARLLNPSVQALLDLLERGVRPTMAGPMLGRNRTFATDVGRRCPEVAEALRRGRRKWPPARRRAGEPSARAA